MWDKRIFLGAVGATVTLFALCSTGTESAALQIDPRCAKASNKLSCTCALQNGGYRTFTTRNWTVISSNTRDGRGSTNDAYAQCILKNGGR
jgi:hypothetical protein